MMAPFITCSSSLPARYRHVHFECKHCGLVWKDDRWPVHAPFLIGPGSDPPPARIPGRDFPHFLGSPWIGNPYHCTPERGHSHEMVVVLRNESQSHGAHTPSRAD